MPRFEPDPEYEAERRRLRALPFRMPIEDVFHLKGRGTAITGRVEAGVLREGDAIVIVGGTQPLHTQAMRFEIFGYIDQTEAGDNIGILLPKDVTPEQIRPGMIVTTNET